MLKQDLITLEKAIDRCKTYCTDTLEEAEKELIEDNQREQMKNYRTFFLGYMQQSLDNLAKVTPDENNVHRINDYKSDKSSRQ